MEPVVIKKVEELEELRCKIESELNTIKEAFKRIKEMEAQLVAKDDTRHMVITYDIIKKSLSHELIFYTEDIMDRVDSFLWKLCLAHTGVLSIVTSESKKKIEDKFTTKLDGGDYVPKFQAKTVTEFIDSIYANIKNFRIFSVGTVYTALNKSFFKKGKNKPTERRACNAVPKSHRFCHFTAVDDASIRWTDEQCDFFGDIENAFRLLDGKPSLLPQQRISSVLRGMENKRFPDDGVHLKCDYFHLTIFKRGTVKIDFIDDKLLSEFNLIGPKGALLPCPDIFK